MAETLKTPAGADRHQRQELRPLPMRISQSTYDRLDRLRAVDDLPIQEHVRRALDYYLEHVELVLVLAKSGHVERSIAAVKQDPLIPKDDNTIPNMLATRKPLTVGQR